MPDDLPPLTYGRLDVYRLAIDYVTLMAPLLETLPRGNAALADQLKRASLSIPLNIAEAAGKVSTADRSRYYATARGSAPWNAERCWMSAGLWGPSTKGPREEDGRC
jgi:hypothetical protein